MKRALLMLAFVGCADGPPSMLVGEVDRYFLQIDLGRPVKVRSGAVIDVTTPGRCYTLSTRNEPSEVKWNAAEPDSVSFADGKVTVCGPPPTDGRLSIDGVVTVPESSAGEVGLRVFEGETMLLAWLGGCDLFALCDPRVDALVDVDIAVLNRGGQVLCGGSLERGNTQTRCLMRDVPTYAGFTVVQGERWQEFGLNLGDGRLVRSFSDDFTMPSRLQSELDPMVAWLETTLGPSPWRELRVAEVGFDWAGFEGPGLVLVRRGLVRAPAGDYAEPFVHTLAHELVHQWAGIRTTLAAPADIVWKEAIAEYVTMLYEHFRSKDWSARSRRFYDGYGTAASYYPMALDAAPLDGLAAAGYGAGTMAFFVQLEPLIGAEDVLAAIKSFLAEPGVRSNQDLLDALEAASGEDLTAYAEAWLIGSGDPERPSFDVTVEAAGEGEVAVRVVQSADVATIFPCVVEVELRSAQQSVLVPVSFGLEPTEREAVAVVPFDGAVDEIVVDPRNRVMSWR